MKSFVQEFINKNAVFFNSLEARGIDWRHHGGQFFSLFKNNRIVKLSFPIILPDDNKINIIVKQRSKNQISLLVTENVRYYNTIIKNEIIYNDNQAIIFSWLDNENIEKLSGFPHFKATREKAYVENHQKYVDESWKKLAPSKLYIRHRNYSRLVDTLEKSSLRKYVPHFRYTPYGIFFSNKTYMEWAKTGKDLNIPFITFDFDNNYFMVFLLKPHAGAEILLTTTDLCEVIDYYVKVLNAMWN